MTGLTGAALRPIGGLIAFGVGAGAVFAIRPSATQAVIQPLCETLKSLGQEGCQLAYTAPQEAFGLLLRQAVLAGAILATPCLIVQFARLVAPTLSRTNPEGVVPFAVAGGIVAILGAAFAVFIEAPGAFAPVLISLGEMSSDLETLAMLGDYVRAALIMAASYAATLQLPVLVIMMIKSLRTRRVLQAEAAA